MSAKDAVCKASKQFYSALNLMLKGDAGKLSDIWSHNASVTTMHPIGGREVGWKKVSESWKQVAKLSSGGKVKLNNQIINISGNVAYELGIEQGKFKLAGKQISIKHRVTNIYQKKAGKWKEAVENKNYEHFGGAAQ